MTPTEADQLALKITQSWPSTRIPATTWAEDIADLDAGYTGTAIVQLRRTLDRPPTIAELRSAVTRMTPRPITGTVIGNGISFHDHLSARIWQAVDQHNHGARAEVEQWIAAHNGTGFGANVLGPKMRRTVATAIAELCEPSPFSPLDNPDVTWRDYATPETIAEHDGAAA